jgi:hypothetical protein
MLSFLTGHEVEAQPAMRTNMTNRIKKKIKIKAKIRRGGGGHHLVAPQGAAGNVFVGIDPFLDFQFHLIEDGVNNSYVFSKDF